ncbi:MAG: DMT family transporter [candidate division Zixibacteria bacterium]|jgi:drug/metabolite transporter (DMT)-like permease|nr:DMT family transporter [candidate division Zixibacteria bacterium]
MAMLSRLKLLFCVVIWGWTFVATKVVLSYVTPVELLGLRLLLALPVLLAVVRLKRIRFRFGLRDSGKVALGSAIITAHFLIQITGLQYTSATNTGWIISITPLVLAVLSFLFLNERLGIREYAGIAVATAGILLLVSHGNLSSFEWLSSVGDWLVLASAHTWALYTIATRDLSRAHNPLALTFAVLAPAGLMILGYMAVTSDWERFLHLPADAVVALLFLGVLGLAIAHWFWQEGVADIGAARAGIFLYLEPVATTVLAVPYLGEQFTWATALGGLAVLGGVYFGQRRRKPKRAAVSIAADDH